MQFSVDRPCQLVLRHNQDLQVSTEIRPGDIVMEKLLELDERARTHPRYNKKITGEKKILEHAKLNNMNLRQLVDVAVRRGECGYRLVFLQ